MAVVVSQTLFYVICAMLRTSGRAQGLLSTAVPCLVYIHSFVDKCTQGDILQRTIQVAVFTRFGLSINMFCVDFYNAVLCETIMKCLFF